MSYSLWNCGRALSNC